MKRDAIKLVPTCPTALRCRTPGPIKCEYIHAIHYQVLASTWIYIYV